MSAGARTGEFPALVDVPESEPAEFIYRFDERNTIGDLLMVVDALQQFGQNPRLRLKKDYTEKPMLELVGDAPRGLQLVPGGAS